jgi:hypothetical protein
MRVLLVWHATLPADAGERRGGVLSGCQRRRESGMIFILTE